MTNGFGIVIDGVVAILLMVTIGYCIMLNRRLKLTVHECDNGLGERLRKAERVTVEIERAAVAGKELLSRLSQIVTAGRGHDHPVAAVGDARREEPKAEIGNKHEAKPEVRTDAKAVAAAAEAFAARVRNKVHGLAA